MNIDELKQSWHSMKEELGRLEELNRDLTEQLYRSKAMPYKNRIMRQYRILSVLCVAMIFMQLICIVEDNLIFSREISGILIFYFAAMLFLNLIFTSRLRHIDINTMPMAEMIERTINLRILRSRLKKVGYVLMIPVMTLLLWSFYVEDIVLFAGGVAGGVVGLIVGLRIDRKIDRDIKKMKATLEDELSESGL